MKPYLKSNNSDSLNDENQELLAMIGKFFTFNLKTCLKSSEDGTRTIFFNVINIVEYIK